MPDDRRRVDKAAWTYRVGMLAVMGLAGVALHDARDDLKNLVKFAVATDRKLDAHEFRLADHDRRLKDHAERLRPLEREATWRRGGGAAEPTR